MGVMRVRKRPRLAIEMGNLGCVDPFELEVSEEPPGSGTFRLRVPGTKGKSSAAALEAERAALCVAGCSQALMDLSLRWYVETHPEAGKGAGTDAPPPMGEMRLVVRRREARLLGALLRRHVARLPQPPKWMDDLLRGIEEMDEFLRWTLD